MYSINFLLEILTLDVAKIDNFNFFSKCLQKCVVNKSQQSCIIFLIVFGYFSHTSRRVTPFDLLQSKKILTQLTYYHIEVLFVLNPFDHQRFSDVFMGYRKRPVAWNGLILILIFNFVSIIVMISFFKT